MTWPTPYDHWRKTAEVIKADGFTFLSPNGHVCVRPEVAIYNQTLKTLNQIRSEFGMTPAARTRVNVEDSRPDPESEFSKLERQASELRTRPTLVD
jgi:P27 family predicted phage terminase small subunit